MISTPNKKIMFLGKLFSGKIHDFTMFKDTLKQYDFSALETMVDLGFLGIKKVLSTSKIIIPNKGSKNHQLTQQQKDENVIISRLRVPVENAIGGVKRYFILSIKNRMKLEYKFDDAMEICTNLWNFKKSFINN